MLANRISRCNSCHLKNLHGLQSAITAVTALTRLNFSFHIVGQRYVLCYSSLEFSQNVCLTCLLALYFFRSCMVNGACQIYILISYLVINKAPRCSLNLNIFKFSEKIFYIPISYESFGYCLHFLFTFSFLELEGASKESMQIVFAFVIRSERHIQTGIQRDYKTGFRRHVEEQNSTAWCLLFSTVKPKKSSIKNEFAKWNVRCHFLYE